MMEHTTTRNKRETQAFESSERLECFQVFFQQSSDALVVVDRQGVICMVNPVAEGLLGYDSGELLDQPVDVLIPPSVKNHSAHMAHFFSNPQTRPMSKGLEIKIQHKDGYAFPVDIALSPLEVAGKKVVACSIRDLRERSFGSDVLRLQATALRSAANGIVITDMRGYIIWCNPAAQKITGYTHGELLGQHTRILKSDQHDDEFYRTIWETIMKGEVWNGIIINRRKDGQLYHEEQTIAPVLDENGQIKISSP